MQTLTLYHNPRCSKSRKTLQLIEDAGLSPRIVEYLGTPPDGAEILRLCGLLGIRPAELLRRGEPAFRDAPVPPDLDDDAALADFMSAHPITIERPIVVDEDAGRAVIGRPPENVRALLQS